MHLELFLIRTCACVANRGELVSEMRGEEVSYMNDSAIERKRSFLKN
jgi:hypothetical protein